MSFVNLRNERRGAEGPGMVLGNFLDEGYDSPAAIRPAAPFHPFGDGVHGPWSEGHPGARRGFDP